MKFRSLELGLTAFSTKSTATISIFSYIYNILHALTHELDIIPTHETSPSN